MKRHLDKILPVLLEKKKSVLILHDPNTEFTIRAIQISRWILRVCTSAQCYLWNALSKHKEGETLICSPWKPEHCP